MVKISDFGVSKQTAGTSLRTMVGTISYMAPEILDDYFSSYTSVYTNAVDIWSLGCLIHDIVTKETPFPDTRKLEDYVRGRIPFPRTKLIETRASSATIEFISKLLLPLPGKRLTAIQALNDPWLDMGQAQAHREDAWAPNCSSVCRSERLYSRKG